MHRFSPLVLAFLLAACAQAGPAPGQPSGQQPPAGQEQPVNGGELVFVVGSEPPSFDGHKETTFAMVHPTAPHYSVLLRFSADQYPNIEGDAAESWTTAQDGLTYTFKLRSGIKFQDGAALTSADVKATYDKIINPQGGAGSARKGSYSGAIDRVDAPDPSTVVFRLKQPSAAVLNNLASPWNYLYKSSQLGQDPRWYEKNVQGTGPFTYVEYVPGSHWVGKKNPDYFMKGKPYLDSFRAVFIKDVSAQVAAVRSGRAHVEFRSFTPPQRDDLVRAMGKDITVQESPWTNTLTVAINTEKPPWNDPRARRALSLALDRWEGSKALSQITFVKGVGGLQRPGAPLSMPEGELVKIAGFSKDGSATKNQAKALLREAGVPDGYSFTLLNRDIPVPYEATAIYLIDQWSKIGLRVNQVTKESGPYFSDLTAGSYEVAVDFLADFMDEPDLQLSKFLSREKSSVNYGRYSDPTLDDLYAKQSAETNPERRKQLVWQYERRVLDEMAYSFPALWWERIIPHSTKMRGWKIMPSHYLNQDLATIWLAP